MTDAQRVLVLGATGFLGTEVTRVAVRDGHAVTAVSRRIPASMTPGVEYCAVELDGPAAAGFFHPWRWDGVVNAAGSVPRTQGDRNPWDVLAEHVAIALNLCLAIPVQWTGRFIQISTMSVYGLPLHLPVKEDHPRRPVGGYAVGKRLAEDICFGHAQRQGWDLWVLRLPGLFSELRHDGALFNFVRAAMAGRPLELTAGEPVSWDVLHVTDAAEAISRALRAPARAPGAVNIGHGEPVSLTLMAEYLAARGGRALPIRNVSGVVHPVFQMDIGKAAGLLAWKPGPLAARVDRLWSAMQETVVA